MICSCIALVGLFGITFAKHESPPDLLAIQNQDESLYIFNEQTRHVATSKRTPLRIGVIGAGAAGSSFVYYLSKLLNDQRDAVDIHMFDRNDRIGGRARVVRLNVSVCHTPDSSHISCSNETIPVELGASIFAKANYNLVNASKEFNLTIQEKATAQQKRVHRLLKHGGQDYLEQHRHASMGVWNGSHWNYLEDPPSSSRWPIFKWFGSIVSSVKLLYTYGFLNGPIQASKLAREMADRYLTIYEYLSSKSVFTTPFEMVRSLNLSDEVSQSCSDYLTSHGISELFQRDLMGGIVRNTYLSEVNDIHAFGGLVALYSGVDEMFSIDGGNYQLFEHMVSHSGISQIHLSTSVTKVVQNDNDTFSVHVSDSSEHDEVYEFDVIVVAAPLPESNIEFVHLTIPTHPKVVYRHLYVTVVHGEVNPAYFGLQTQNQVPYMILTSSPSESDIAFHTFGVIEQTNSTFTVTKYFSSKPLSDETLNKLYLNRDVVYRHAWNMPGSYPRLAPFPDISKWDTPFVVPGTNDRVLYLNAMESWISTMETESVSGRNAAHFLMKSFLQ